jgi:DNA-binding MarR family transcriptional regulator
MSLQLTTAEALRLWHAVNLHLVTDDEPDLSARQLTILLTVYLEAPPHTVRGLAERLKVTKPVITRALDAMGRQGLLGRRRDQDDRRNVLVQRTLKGALFIERLGDTIAARAGEIGRKVA